MKTITEGGGGFNPSIKPTKSAWAFAPETCIRPVLHEVSSFPAGRSAGKTSQGLRWLLFLALFLVLPCTLARAQSDQTGTGQLSGHPLQSANGTIDPTASTDEDDPVAQQRQLRQLIVSLHKSMVSDTDKLQKLVTDLNAELGNANPDSLTPDQLKKIAAIEKLARNVKEAMKTSVQGSSTLKDALTQPPRHIKPSL